MKLLITVYSNRPDVATVKNLSDEPLKLIIQDKIIEILPNKKYSDTPDMLKVKLGNWEKSDDYNEKIRRNMLGISKYEFEVKSEVFVFKTKEIEEDVQIVEKEAEFSALDKLKVQCEALTANGHRCKREKLKGSNYCALHKEKE